MTIESVKTKKRSDDFEDVEIARKDAPDVRFTGRLLAEVDSDTEGRNGGRTNRGRWTRLQLWELKSGTWIAAAIGCSDRQGEIDIGEIERIPPVNAGSRGFTEDRTIGSEMDRANRVMQFFGWTWLAKKLADQLGWDTVEVIDE